MDGLTSRCVSRVDDVNNEAISGTGLYQLLKLHFRAHADLPHLLPGSLFTSCKSQKASVLSFVTIIMHLQPMWLRTESI
jgi:hypothetical protein